MRSSFSLRQTFLPAAVLIASAALSNPSLADSRINTGYFGNVAIQGYDPVAYFTESEAVKGSEEHAVKWLGANWHFANEEHKEMFSADPTKYAPQYGGHCATGMAIHGGLTKDIDPEAWAIIDGKLYLNYSKLTNKMLSREGRVSPGKADEKWKNVAAQ